MSITSGNLYIPCYSYLTYQELATTPLASRDSVFEGADRGGIA